MSPPARQQPPARRDRSRRVLIVEDDAPYAALLRDYLEKELGYEVVGLAGDAHTAMEGVRDHQAPDLVLIDLTAPAVDGLEGARGIAEECPDAILIGLSGYDDRQFGDALRAVGGSACVLKEDVVDRLPQLLRSLWMQSGRR